MTLPRSLDDLAGKRAALWLRESTKGQHDRYGPEAQREQYARAIERYGLVETGIEWSVSHSGRTVGATTAFGDMVTRAGRDYEVLVVGYVSRFARDLRTAVNARHDLHQGGAAILFADERILSSDERAWEEWAREAVEAESYSRRLGRRIREGLDAKWRRENDQAGPVPLGFRRNERHVLEIDPATIGKVVAMYREYADGLVSIKTLAAANSMDDRALNEILKHPIYNGWVRQKGELKEAAWRGNPPVSDALWEKVAGIRHQRRHGGGPHGQHPDPLAGLLYCQCGQHIRADGRSQGGYRRRHPKPCEFWTGTTTVPRAYYEQAIDAQVSQLDLSNAVIEQVVAALSSRPTPKVSDMQKVRVQRQLRELALEHAAGRIADEDYLRRSRELREIPTTEDHPPLLPADKAVLGLRNFSQIWGNADTETKAKLIHKLYERITVNGKTFIGARLTEEAYDMGFALALPECALARPTGVRRELTIPVHGRLAMEATA